MCVYTYLVANQSQDANTCEDGLSRNSVLRNPIRVSLLVGYLRLTQVTHEHV